jgi:cyclic pyranopterin phosphate synthase
MVEYLRLSLTDRCNLNCVYCTPLEKDGFLRHDELLRHEELARAALAFVRAGVKKIRLTGGEPLLKKNIVGLVKLLNDIPGLKELALTTNGLLLPELAAPLRAAGLDRVNISLDTLKKETFKKITGSDGLDKVWDGVMRSLSAGFSEVKLNAVLMKGFNYGEAAEFARLSLELPLTVRFIEFYPANSRSGRLAGAFCPTAETKKSIEDALGPLERLPPGPAEGPARVYRLRGAKGKIGFISGRSDYFCPACNRVRMDCAGKVYPCLYSPHTHDLRGLLRGGADAEALAGYIKNIFLVKSNYRKGSATARHIEMSDLGG